MTASAGKTTRVVTRELLPSDYNEWSELVAQSEHGSVYALPAYLEALCRATGAGFRIAGVYLDGRLAGGVPLYERRARSGSYVANRLLLYYNGIVLHLPEKKFPSDATSQELGVLQALADDLGRRPYVRLQLHNRSTVQDVRPFLAQGWQARLSYTYVIPLADPAAQWDRVDPNLKRLIVRCERDGVSYREDDDFDALFRLHLATHRRKGAPLYLPEKVFAAWFRELSAAGLARLGHAIFDGKVIASQLMLVGPHAVAHTVCAGADDEYLRMGASAFLRWHSCLALARAGYRANDLTDAALNPVTRFKSQLGAALTPTWSLSRGDSMMFRLESAAQNWRTARARRRAMASEPE
jgi:Acetyltransferase (GNAT) domain